tara:strand:- start:245 stop:490 length:246 start_codon:yes stop_codon:yes gene_type:complete
MEEEEVKQKLVSAIGTDILNQLSLNGVIEASRFYSVQLAEQHYAKLNDDQKKQLLANLDAKMPLPEALSLDEAAGQAVKED